MREHQVERTLKVEFYQESNYHFKVVVGGKI